MFGGAGHSYFDSVTMIITFVLVGKYLEVIGKKNAVDSIDTIRSQIPIDAMVIRDGVKLNIALDEVVLGDIIELKIGEKASVDGEVMSGNASFDESSISGESLPIYKKIGDKIFGGTINTDGLIRYKATTDFQHSTLNNIVTLIEDSLGSKPDIENRANELSKYFSIAILSIAVGTFLLWYLYNGDFEIALINSISVIIIACPCALALATPIASLIGISWLAKKKLIFKEAKYLETMAKVDTVVFDKTGTITEGKLKVIKENIKNELTTEDLNLIYLIASSSSHPISLAIKTHLENRVSIEQKENKIDNFQAVDGKGIKGVYQNKEIVAGNLSLLKQSGVDIDFKTEYSIFAIAVDKKLMAIYELEDSIKEEAKRSIECFKENNINIVMLTGDNRSVAKRVGNALGIDNINSEMTPQDKAIYLKDLKKRGHTIVMTGDGLNDAPALALADVSVVMGSGADVSIGISDIIILDNSLKGLVDSFIISKRTYKFIKQNLMISFVYNIVTIPLAVFGYVIPLVAALSMSLSSLLVVGNSMRIKLGSK
jgi:Cu+-exporting ATPase